ncbi:MAG: 3-oxoacyl-ACP reductase [Rhodospirillaceae bacterium]|nr:3-oxoacyl-ACP reductase [Rhodospirillaceae bacterium]|tara:strand:- start:170 stop:919 length:750 start_codon:yes stop_codon:yes gene_type:complete
MNKIDLEGRVAAITGGARGIGLAAAQRLHASGARIALWDVDEARMAKAKADLGGNDVIACKVDVTDPASVDQACKDTVAAFGKLDILVNNAGVAGLSAKVIDMPVEEWRRVVDIDLTGVFLCTKAVLPPMIKNGYGRIVNVASIAGKEGNPNASPYSAAKAGVIALTKSVAKEVVGTGVICNCITPAVIQTEILEQVSQEHIDYMVSRIPLGRTGQAEEVGALIAWLSSEDCSFSTGAAFDISGGRATY